MMFDLDFPYAHGGPLSSARFRTTPEDFIVDEQLGFEPEAAGEHVYLHIRKRGTNTEWLAAQIARFAGASPRDVGYCGLKDRHAVTSQWFSVYLPKTPEPDWDGLTGAVDEGVELLNVSRGVRKLRRGQHACNRFRILVRQVQGDQPALEQRLQVIQHQGVPNYYGEQRFGHQGQNLALAQSWLVDGRPIRARAQKSRAMSSARSYLFNRVLAERVNARVWNQTVPGDVLSDAGLPTAPLWGRGRSQAQDAAAQLETNALKGMSGWMNGLEHCGLKQERRALVLKPANMSWRGADDWLELAFDLPPGQFATALLRELFVLENASQPDGPRDPGDPML